MSASTERLNFALEGTRDSFPRTLLYSELSVTGPSACCSAVLTSVAAVMRLARACLKAVWRTAAEVDAAADMAGAGSLTGTVFEALAYATGARLVGGGCLECGKYCRPNFRNTTDSCIIRATHFTKHLRQSCSSRSTFPRHRTLRTAHLCLCERGELLLVHSLRAAVSDVAASAQELCLRSPDCTLSPNPLLLSRQALDCSSLLKPLIASSTIVSAVSA